MSPAIAIVGMACVYPDANSPRALWENVLAKRRAFRRIPRERFDLGDYWSADAPRDETTYSTEAALIEGWAFDRVGFRVTGEAYRSSDPAHWLALDVAARALADADFANAEGLPRDRTGVLVGNTLTGEFSRAALMRLRWPYVRRVVEHQLSRRGWEAVERGEFLRDLERDYKQPFAALTEESLAGGLSNTIAGRVCNFFNLGGGGYTVDGACSSSLIAVSNACRGLTAGEMDVALAGGVDLSLDPFELLGFAQLGALARDEMRVYDRASEGFWPGEGCGFVVLMRHDDALARGARCYAVVRGWGISSDGGGGITRPKREGQRTAIERAYRLAGYGADQVMLFEGHGTGTPVGDEVELEALAAARRACGGCTPPAAVGSVKANIGHTKAAAGVAGLIKAVMAVHAQVLPPATGCEQPHPVLEEQARHLRMLRGGEAWPAELPLYAGISSFGFGGINVHVAIEGVGDARRSVLSPAETRLLGSAQDAELFVLGAGDARGLAAVIERIGALAARLSRAELTDLAATLACEPGDRTARAAVVAATPAGLAQSLAALRDSLAAGETRVMDQARARFLDVRGAGPARIGYLFPGQASPVRLAGGALATRFPAVAPIYQALAVHLDGSANATNAAAQPAILSAEVAALQVLDALGLQARVALGHSLGELAALHWAGCLGADEVLALARARGAAMAVGGSAGAMAGIAADTATVAALCEGVDGVCVAGHNGAAQTAVSGRADSVGALLARAKAAGIGATRLAVSHAFHSPLMTPAKAPFAAHLAALALAPPRRPVYSTVYGSVLDDDADLRTLLLDQLTEPVRFVEALDAARGAADLWIEVGPGEVLSGLARAAGVDAIPVDAAGPSLRGLLAAVGACHALGAPVDPGALFADRFTRPFTLDWQPRFLVSPCEQAPSGPEPVERAARWPREPAPEAVAPAMMERECDPDDAGALPIIENLRQRVAKRAELPPAAIADSSRLLVDLHLNSIAVSQIVAEAARDLGRRVPGAPLEFADATLAQVAEAINALPRANWGAAGKTVDDAVGEEVPAGVANWVRPFPIVDVPCVGTGTQRSPQGKGGWQLLTAQPTAFTRALAVSLDVFGGCGVAVCLPPDPDFSALVMLLEGARAALNPARRYFLLVQHGGGGASLARCLHLEAPHLTICVVDLAGDEQAPARVIEELRIASGYHEALYNEDGRRSEPRLAPAQTLAPAHTLPLGPADLLLVTGGGKGIAAECAAALAARTGVRLALMGRSDSRADTELRANLDRLAALGATVRYLCADVTDARAVATSVAGLVAEWGPVTAILHGAGSNRPCPIRDLDAEALWATRAPKVDGLSNLLAAVDPESLSLLVGFGSVIARTGLPGEADYALANEWLARAIEAHGRRFAHCRCLTLEWSVWSGVGMGQRLGSVEALERQGIVPIGVDDGVELLARILAGKAAGAVLLAGRLPDLPTLRREHSELPFRRFLERTRAHFPGVELVVEADLSGASDPYLAEHVVGGEWVLPAVLGLEAMAQVAGALARTDEAPVFESMRFARPVVVPVGGVETVRIAALLREPGCVEVVLRTAATGYGADHFRATCRFGAPRDTTHAKLEPAPPAALDARRDLYGGLLFHAGRFQRLGRYRGLDARSCECEILPAATPLAPWFGRHLPETLLLGDPAARDAAIHAIQACVPHARLVPVAVERLAAAGDAATGGFTVRARERWREGDEFCYDLEIMGEDGRVREAWQGLRLRKVEGYRNGRWPPALLATYLERRAEELLPRAALRVALRRSNGGARRDNSLYALRALLGAGAAIHHRPDGKPQAPGSGRDVSAAHGGHFTLAVAGTSRVACDLEPVVARAASQWGDLLGPAGQDLGVRIRDAMREPHDIACTRAWTVRECLKKAGVSERTPCTLHAARDDDWVMLRAGALSIASYVAGMGADESPLAIALLAGAHDAPA